MYNIHLAVSFLESLQKNCQNEKKKKKELSERPGFVHQEHHGQAPVPVPRHSLMKSTASIRNDNYK